MNSLIELIRRSIRDLYGASMQTLRLLRLLTIAVILSACGNNEKVTHSAFPDAITVTKTSAHIHIPNTKFFVVPPQGYSKGATGYELGESTLNAFSISQSAGSTLATTLDGVKREIETEHDAKIREIKPVTYNGMAGIYSERISMGKFHSAELRVPLKDGTILSIQGSYTYETAPENIERVFTAMRQALYDEQYQIDVMAESNYQLSDSGSRFRFAKDDKRRFYYTLGGKPCGEYCKMPYLHFFETLKESKRDGKLVFDPGEKDRFPSYEPNLAQAGFLVKLKGNRKEFVQSGRRAREMVLEGIGIDGEPVVLFLREVNHGYGVVVMLGVAKEGDDKSISDFRKLAATLVIKE